MEDDYYMRKGDVSWKFIVLIAITGLLAIVVLFAVSRIFGVLL